MTELDKQVAIEVMGWKWKRIPRLFERPIGGGVSRILLDTELPPFSTDLVQAFQVVELMRKKFGVLIRDLVCPQRWRCEFNDPGDPIICGGVGHATKESSEDPWQWIVEHQSLPAAICLAALAAVRGK